MSTLFYDPTKSGGNWSASQWGPSGGPYASGPPTDATTDAEANGAVGIIIDSAIITAGTLRNANGGSFSVSVGAGDKRINANIQSSAIPCVVWNTASAVFALTIFGNITGGSSSNARGIDASGVNTKAMLNIGDATRQFAVTGGTASGAYGVYNLGGYASLFYANLVAGLDNAVRWGDFNGTAVIAEGLTINGSVTNSATASAIRDDGGALMLNGAMIQIVAGPLPILVSQSVTNPGKFYWNSPDGTTVTLRDTSSNAHILKVPQYPAVGDVESGVGYDYSAFAGTFTSPPLGKVNSDTSWGAGGVEFAGTLNMGLYALINVSPSKYARTMADSPADVIRQLIVDLGYGTDAGDWPVKSHIEPDRPDNCITVYDYTGKDFGKEMSTSERHEKPGIQVRVRSGDYATGYVKANAVSIALDQISLASSNTDVTLGTSTYNVWEVARAGPINYLGKEPGSERIVFTFTAILTLKQEL